MAVIVDLDGRINFEELVKLILSRPVQYVVIGAEGAPARQEHGAAAGAVPAAPAPELPRLLPALGRRCDTLEAALWHAVETAGSLRRELDDRQVALAAVLEKHEKREKHQKHGKPGEKHEKHEQIGKQREKHEKHEKLGKPDEKLEKHEKPGKQHEKHEKRKKIEKREKHGKQVHFDRLGRAFQKDDSLQDRAELPRAADASGATARAREERSESCCENEEYFGRLGKALWKDDFLQALAEQLRAAEASGATARAQEERSERCSGAGSPSESDDDSSGGHLHRGGYRGPRRWRPEDEEEDPEEEECSEEEWDSERDASEEARLDEEHEESFYQDKYEEYQANRANCFMTVEPSHEDKAECEQQ